MTTLHGGPADKSTHLLKRGPRFLRVAEHPTKTDAGRFLVLANVEVNTEPFAGWRMHAYRRLKPTEKRYTILKGVEEYVVGEYEHVPGQEQPDQATMLVNADWQAWCVRQAERDAQGQTDRHPEEPS